MRKKTVSIQERFFMQAIGGQLFAQAPLCQPRKVDIIMKKVGEQFRKDAVETMSQWFVLMVEEDKLKEYLRKTLLSIPEFEELNLSQMEYDNGVKVHDEDRGKFKFTSAYDVETSESWKYDFIDLDAFIGNAERNIWMLMDYETDCFCCIHNPRDGESRPKECSTCLVNPGFKINYETCRYPKGKYTFACKHNCKCDYYIGCDECDKKDTCEHRCESSCEGCELAINHIDR